MIEPNLEQWQRSHNTWYRIMVYGPCADCELKTWFVLGANYLFLEWLVHDELWQKCSIKHRASWTSWMKSMHEIADRLAAKMANAWTHVEHNSYLKNTWGEIIKSVFRRQFKEGLHHAAAHFLANGDVEHLRSQSHLISKWSTSEKKSSFSDPFQIVNLVSMSLFGALASFNMWPWPKLENMKPWEHSSAVKTLFPSSHCYKLCTTLNFQCTTIMLSLQQADLLNRDLGCERSTLSTYLFPHTRWIESSGELLQVDRGTFLVRKVQELWNPIRFCEK